MLYCTVCSCICNRFSGVAKIEKDGKAQNVQISDGAVNAEAVRSSLGGAWYGII